MTSLSEISVVHLLPAPERSADGDSSGARDSWVPLELTRAGRLSPVPLVVCALLAGIGAMVLGGLAVVYATRSADDGPGVAATLAVAKPISEAERRVLALLAKPSTDRIVFRGSGGRLVLVVGSGGRAAILVHGFPPASAERPQYAWVIRSGKPVRAAALTGAERAVFLSVGVGRRDAVAVAPDRDAALATRPGHVVAVRS